MTTFYHRTTEGRAVSILANGFRDGTERPVGDLIGVFLSVDPNLGEEEVPDGVVLVIDLPDSESDLSYYELVEEGKPYREWLVPAALINSRGAVRRL